MPGLIEEGFNLRGQAQQGMADVAELEAKRRAENKLNQAILDQSKGEMVGTIAGALASAGMNAVGTTPEAAGSGTNTSVGGKGGAAAFAPGEIKGAAVTQGSLPQSRAGMGTLQRSNAPILPEAKNASVAQGALPSSPMVADQRATPHWTHFLVDW